MAGVPEGWASFRLGDVIWPSTTRAEAPHSPDMSYLGLEHVQSDTNRILSFGTASDVKSTANIFREGDVLYGKLRPYLNKVIVAPFSGCCSTEFLVFPKRDHIESRFLMWFLSRPQTVQYASHASAGVQLPRVKFDAMAELEITLPPIAEQRRIVVKLESLLEQVNRAKARLDRVTNIVTRFRQAVLAAAWSGELTRDWRDTESGTEMGADVLVEQLLRASPKRVLTLRGDLDLPELPSSWRWVSLRFLMSPEEPFCYGVVQPGPEDPNGVPLIRAGDLHDLENSLSSLRTIGPEIDRSYARSRVKGGEILITVVGANVGTSALVPENARGSNIARAVAKVPVREVSAEYVLYWLHSTLAYSWMVGDAREVARPTLNLEQLETLPVPLTSMSEQQEIVGRVRRLLELADIIEGRVVANSTRTSRLGGAILSKAFSGELVPTEADLARAEGRTYETAEELLARVRESAKHTSPASGSALKQGRSRRHRRRVS
jgi:type I restriction enzyme, S subunit